MVKGDAKIKIFHSMLKYNNLVVDKNLSGTVIYFMTNVHWKEVSGYAIGPDLFLSLKCPLITGVVA